VSSIEILPPAMQRGKGVSTAQTGRSCKGRASLTEGERGARADIKTATGRHGCRRVGPPAGFLRPEGGRCEHQRLVAATETTANDAYGAAKSGCDDQDGLRVSLSSDGQRGTATAETTHR
jgi:hypothetical protein